MVPPETLPAHLTALLEMVPGTVQHLRDAGDEIQRGPGGLRAQFGSGSPPAHKTIVRNTAEQKDFHGMGRL